MTDIIKLTVVLTLTGVVAALLIAFTNSKTEAKIRDQAIQAQTSALESIMTPGATITEVVGTTENGLPPQYWTGVNGSDTSYAFKTGSFGYSSTIVYLVCVSSDGTIQGMSILEQNETPGLGTRVQEIISNKYLWNGLFSKKEESSPWFTEQFKGVNIFKPVTIEKSSGEWHKMDKESREKLLQNNGVTAITGATISTRAVVSGIESQAKKYLNAIKGNGL
ncbi:MAG: FMN-binding protein [Chitinispirillaceae bacterium]|nr:FMN-binding protein [Chitinispirillaceae bacterium]